MGYGFDIFSILFSLVFLLVFVTIISTLFKNWKRERKNDTAPRLSVEATIVTKRMQVYGGHNRTAGHSSYYATFQVESGDRMELEDPSNEYGYLVENDHGTLTFQGTRFLCFQRT